MLTEARADDCSFVLRPQPPPAVRKWSNLIRLRENLDNLVKIKIGRQMGVAQ